MENYMQLIQMRNKCNYPFQAHQQNSWLLIQKQKQPVQMLNHIEFQKLSACEKQKKIISFSKQKCQSNRNTMKRKQLRMGSSIQLIKHLRTRSISSFTVPTFSEEKTLYSSQQQPSIAALNENNLFRAVNEPLSREKLSQKKLNIINLTTISSQSQLDWGKKIKKKTRRLTGLVDYGKNQYEQSTFDDKKQQNPRNQANSNKLQFRSNTRTATKTKKNTTLYQTNLHPNNYYVDYTNRRKSEENEKILVLSSQNIEQQENKKSINRFDFQFGKKLGSGNFGEAFLVRHKKTGLICAMKIMQKKKIRDDQYQGQIARQILIQSYFRHSNVVQLYGFFQDFENIYLLMQFCNEGHLYGLIRKNNRLDNEKTSQIVKGVAKGIQYIHRQFVIHRDLKPENIFINFGVAKIGDFGWAVYRGQNGVLRKTISGSPLYYSPQIVQKQYYDQKIDIWGLGTIAFQCLVGMAPFKVYSFINLDRIVNDELHFPTYIQISQEAVDFIQKCLQKRPQNRWSIEKVLRHQFLNFPQ